MIEADEFLETMPCRYGIMSFFRNDAIIGRSLREYGEWAQAEIDFLLSLIKPGDIVIDAGAFIGTHTLAFAKHVGLSGQVYAFEPNPRAFEVLHLNVIHNELTNVIPFDVALSDVSGSAGVQQLDPTESDNPGKFSLSISPGLSTHVETIVINTETLDKYKLEKCDLLKIDVEGWELKVLQGAVETIRRFRPIIYTECLSIHNGWQLYEFMKQEGFHFFLHNELCFNPRNFRNSKKNFLVDARESNLVFVPEEKLSSFNEQYSDYKDLVTIGTLDDLALGLLKKPQYKYEVLANTRTADVLGNDFWANEPEMRRLSEEKNRLNKQLAVSKEVTQKEIGRLIEEKYTLDKQIDENKKALYEKEMQIGRLIEEKVGLDKQNEESQQALSEKEMEIIRLIEEKDGLDKLLEESKQALHEKDVETARLGQAEENLRLILDSVYRSKSWRMTEPLRRIRASVRKPSGGRKSEVGIALIPRDLLYSIDSITIQDTRIFGWGWLYHRNQSVNSISLKANTEKGLIEIACKTGIHRKDVAAAYPNHPGASYSGFLIEGHLPAKDFSEPHLQVSLEDGEVVLISLSEYIRRPKRYLIQQIKGTLNSALCSPGGHIARRMRNALRNLTRGEFVTLFQKVKHFSFNRTSHKVDLPSLLSRDEGKFPPNIVLLDHNLGGGANHFRDGRIKERVSIGERIWLVFYDLASLQYRVRVYSTEGQRTYSISSFDEIKTILGSASIDELCTNNLYSYEDPLKVIRSIIKLKHQTGASLTVPIHDYFAVCPSYTLLDETGSFCGIPDNLRRCKNCLRLNKGEWMTLIDDQDIHAWRRTWSALLDEATKILCFSDSSVDLILRAYKDLDATKIHVQPHIVDYLPQRRIETPQSDTLHIGIMGTILEQKGADIVREMVHIIDSRSLPIKITIIGMMMDPPESQSLRVLGAYTREQIPDVILESGANLFFVPSIWPETFSYVTEELVQLGVPVAVFDIGAPPERVSKYKHGLIMPKINAEKALEAMMHWHEKRRPPKVKERLCKPNIREPLTTYVFTSAAVNYLPKVRMLCRSIKEHHPEFMVYLALPDKLPSWLDISDEPFDNVITIDQLEIQNAKGWIFQHSLVELSTAIKPFVMRFLLNHSNCSEVIYFDPDMVIFSRLDDLIREFEEASILLTPHITHPESDFEAILDNEINSALKHGIYNLGFVAVKNTQEGRRFVDWWADRCYHFCIAALDQGLFVDQKWIDLAPGLFQGIRIVRNPRINVATWNITTRELSGNFNEGFKVDGAPLGFYHFTGFDSGEHEIMQQKHASHNPSARILVEWYKNNISHDPIATQTPWAFGTFSNGDTITQQHRLIYRKRTDLQDSFPDPFHVNEGIESYNDWFERRAKIEHPNLFRESRSNYLKLRRDVRNLIRPNKMQMTPFTFPRDLRRTPELLKKTWTLYRSEGLRAVLSRIKGSFRSG